MAELWFEDAAGAQGPAGTVQLRFDDTRPTAVEPLAIPPWIGRSAFPLGISLSRPADPLPLSGIRGYAVAIDDEPGGMPCAARDRCTSSETTISGGIGEDRLEIAALAEGTHQLHAVAVSGSGVKSPVAGHAELRVDLTDPVTRLTGVPLGWANRAVSLVARASDPGSGMAADAAEGPAPFTAIRVDDAAPTVVPGPVATAGVIGEGVHRVAFYARDVAGNVDDGGRSNGLANRAPRVATVRIDRTPPSVAFANSQDPREPELLRAWVSDSLSGPDPSRGRIAMRAGGSGDAFEALPTSVLAGGELRARWDSDAYPPGEYEFRATGHDEAGGTAITARRRNGSPMVLSNPLKVPTAVVAAWAGGRQRRTVPYGRGVRLSGRLTAGVRAPLVGATVRVVERYAIGALPRMRTSSVTTGPDGAYSLRLPAGPSREVEVAFGGGATLGRSAGGPLRLGVRSAVRLSASARVARIGGRPLVFRGRVLPAEAIPAAGKAVQLQFRLAAGEWSEFRTVQTDRWGRFRYAYRFSDDDSSGARFQFRAYVPAHEDWPYEPAGSRPILVIGR